MKPAYLVLHEAGELAGRIKTALARLGECRMCPRSCGVDRLNDERGFCGVGRKSVVASYNAHFGEEDPLVGEHGSGTIFFAGCNLGCRFCQNHDISSDPTAGLEADPDELAGVMLSLQKQGCHNINFVTPSHVVAQILEALPIAIEYGLTVPLVYNTSSYDSLDSLALLDGVVDIYMPDIKMWDSKHATKFLRAADYPDHARAAVREMHRQVGDLIVDESGIAERGLLVRHLVMPEDVAGTAHWMKFLADISRNTYLNMMDQYHPCAEAVAMPPIDRMLTRDEYDAALAEADEFGLTRLDVRSRSFFARFLR
ncbi:radical SAM protein [Pseudodesulfovibrio sp. zrk46]|uniref:radical SAM protein n=1 Tax=Pseudodesulfovibrio sp. zrk46 TaxID=2725288 RepID=UPI00144A2898|nr:radical SAM protein [Pseudodesulfovibrio sp. zrk46]QJB55886.1 radical SAM protein [Pseudodesulfovibrio sp. zrk46]